MDKSGTTQDESWQVALKTAKKIGYIPIAFSQAIRMLVADHINNKGEMRAVTKYQISRLFKGESFKATIYFATKELSEDFLENNKACRIGDLIALYTPLDLASFISCCFLSRQMKKLENPAWGTISPFFVKEGAVGALVGVAIPSIGFGPGLLLAGLRNVAHALMASENVAEYKKYREKLEASGKIVDEELEKQFWNTSSSQVISMLLTLLGYKAEIGDLINPAVTTHQRAADIKNEKLRNFRLAHIWQETFLLKKDQPQEKLDAKDYPKEVDRNKAKPHIEAALCGEMTWLERGKGDFTAKKAPHLFEKIPENPDFEIPEELKDVFNLKELTSMDENDFDALIDQIDAEQDSAKREDVISNKDLAELEKDFG